MKKESLATISLLVGMLILFGLGCKTVQTTESGEKKNEAASSDKKSPPATSRPLHLRTKILAKKRVI